MIAIAYKSCTNFPKSLHDEAADLRNNMLKYLCGLDVNECMFTFSPTGRPKIDGVNIDFSISHSYNAVAVALSCEVINCDAASQINAQLLFDDRCAGNIGIDIERVRSADDFDLCSRIATRRFTAEENAQLSLLSGNDYIEAFFKLWTLKESYCKMTGIGLAGLSGADTNLIKQRYLTDTKILSIGSEVYSLSYCAG